jgi:cytochrome c-type biogenesis protein CcmH/NrfF
MDPNLLYALIGAPILFVIIACIVVYSRRRHQKNIRQTSIKAQEPRAENRAR